MRLIKILITALLAVILLSPVKSYGAGAVKYIHNMSIYADDKGVALHNPEGVACNDESVIIAADTANGRLLMYTYENGTLKGKMEIKVPELPYPVRVRLNSIGEIFALDGKSRRIARISPEGSFLNYIDLSSLPLRGPVVPRSMAVDRDDNIYVLDIFSGRVIILNPEEEFLRQIALPDKDGFFSDITVDFKGTILVVDSINAAVYFAVKNSDSFSPLTKGLSDIIRFPTDLATDNRGRIYLVDRNGSQIAVVGQEGSFLGMISGMGWKEGLLNYPSQICINDHGEVFIADTNNHRIQIFTLLK